MDNKDKETNSFQVLMVPVFVINGILSGIISVVTAYFFKPIWNKIITLFESKNHD